MGAVVTERSFTITVNRMMDRLESPRQRLIRYYASVLGTRAEGGSGERVEGR
jgi:hypothetical protein